MEDSSGKCNCICHKMLGVLLVLFGLTFLLGALDVLSARTVDIIWPIIVVAAGLSSLAKRWCKCCDNKC